MQFARQFRLYYGTHAVWMGIPLKHTCSLQDSLDYTMGHQAVWMGIPIKMHVQFARQFRLCYGTHAVAYMNGDTL